MHDLAKPTAIAIFFAVLWSVAAIIAPTTTFHLGPPIVAATPAFLDDRPAALSSLTGGLVIALATTAALAGADLLRGHSLLPWGGAVIESVVFAFGGTLVACIATISTRKSLAA